MRKSKILSVALAAAMVSSIAVTAAFSANAAVSKDGISGDTVGIAGSFTNWGNPNSETGEVIADIPMTNNNGVWEGTIKIDAVTEDMLGDAMTDDGTGSVPRPGFEGKKCVQFKVRTNNSWTDSWGDYEAAFDRTYNSQTNCAVPAEVGQALTITVKFDTTKVAEGTELTTEDDDSWMVWAISYTAEAGAAEKPASEEPASEEPASEEPASEEPASEEPASEKPASEEPASEKPATESSEDATPVQTGDAASAAALVAVVLASLGTAVVMTKKASAKD